MPDAAAGERNEDPELLRRYAAQGDEAAFAEVVERNVGLVYAAALRQLGGSVHRAREVTQLVFIDLARKARALAGRDDLAGWLYTSTHYAAAKLKRSEQRREQREQEALMMQDMLSGGAADEATWERLRPVLDDAMLALSEADRAVLLQRFFHGRRFAEIGRTLATSEDAARIRTDRALEKLRAILGRRGITSTTAALAATLAHPMVAAAPAGLAATVTGAALAGGAAAGAAAASILFMSTTKWLVGGAAVLALGAGTMAYQRTQEAEAQRIAQVAERERAETQARAAKERGDAAARRQSEAAQRSAAAVVPAAPAEPLKTVAVGSGQVTISSGGTLTMTSSGTGPGGIMMMKEMPADPVEREKIMRETTARSTNSTFGSLYGLAGWTEAQQEQFREVMYARQRAEQELFRAAVMDARAKNPQMTRAEQYEIFEAMRGPSEREDQAAVRQTLGEEAAQALERYQNTLQMRYPVRELTTALAASGTPLAAPQVERLIEILAANARGFDGRTDILALNLDAAAAQMTGILGDAQLIELRGIVTRAQERKKLERERNMAPAGSLKSKGQ